MARNPLLRQRTLVAAAALILFFHAPDFLKVYPQTVVLADAFTWVGDRLMEALATASFFIAISSACSLASDTYRWLACAPAPIPTPAALESGTSGVHPGRLHALAVLEAEVAGVEPPPPPSASTLMSRANWLFKAFAIFQTTVIFALVFSARENLTLDFCLPGADTLGKALLFLLRGGVVIFVALVVYVFGVWLVQRRASVPTRVEVLFDEAGPEEEMSDQKEYMQTEREKV